MRIRLASPSDAAGVLAVYAPIVVATATSFELEAPSVTEMAARIERCLPAHPWLVAEDGSVVVGFAYAGPFSGRGAYAWSVSTSVYLASDTRGQGLGKALYGTLLAVLTAQGYRQAMAGIALPNDASVRLHEGLGFSRVGIHRAVGWKLGAWHDVGWWQRPLGSGSGGPPSAPVALDALPDGVLASILAAQPLRGTNT